MNRETYLEKAVQQLNKKVFKPNGYEVPKDVKVSASWSTSESRLKTARVMGTCSPRSLSEGGYNEITITLNESDSVRILDVLTHELIHAIDDCQHGHGKEFREIAVAVGLKGKMTATVAGEELEATLKEIVEELGEYPHKKLEKGQKKQGTRMLKVECSCCGWNFRTSNSRIEQMTSFDCLACQSSDSLDIA